MGDESMSKDEIQRYIIQCVNNGKTKLETFDGLLEILGIDFPDGPQTRKDNDNR